MSIQPDISDSVGTEELRLERMERRSRLLAVALSTVGVAASILAAMVYLYYAKQQHERADLQAELTVIEAKRAELASANAKTQEALARLGTVQIERSLPVLAISPDGRSSISGAGWLLNDQGKPVTQLVQKAVEATFSPDGSLVFVVPADGKPILASALSGKVSVAFTDLDQVSFAAFSPDGRQLAVGTETGSAKLLSVHTGQRMLILVGGREPLTFVVFSQDGTRLMTASPSGILVWDTASGRALAKLTSGSSPVQGAAFGADSHTILVLYRTGQAGVFDVDTGRQILRFRGYVQSKF